MKYLLDTDIAIYYLKGNPQVAEKIKNAGAASLSISTITLSELYYGAYKSARIQENIEKLKVLRKEIAVLQCSEEIAEGFGKIKSNLEKRGTPVEDFDILIAATATKHDLVLVTNNGRHFEGISDLKLENWLTMY